MALTVNANTIYIPSGETDTDYVPTNSKSISVSGIWVTPSSAGGSLLLEDGGGNTAKLLLVGATANETKFFDLQRMPLIFPNGVRVTTTNCVATLLYSRGGA